MNVKATIVGVFVLGGLVLGVIGVLLFGGEHMFAPDFVWWRIFRIPSPASRSARR